MKYPALIFLGLFALLASACKTGRGPSVLAENYEIADDELAREWEDRAAGARARIPQPVAESVGRVLVFDADRPTEKVLLSVIFQQEYARLKASGVPGRCQFFLPILMKVELDASVALDFHMLIDQECHSEVAAALASFVARHRNAEFDIPEMLTARRWLAALAKTQ